jgi:pimeloyl-ACP methyl ester carboxylesterase
LIVQGFARRNPGKIAGLVLVDATHEDQFRRLEAALIPFGQPRRWSLVTAPAAYRPHQGLPEDVRLLAGTFAARAQSMVVASSELSFLRQTARPAAAADNLPDVPLVVISHRVTTPAASTRDARLADSWMEMQLELATRTRHSKHVIAATDDHYVHIREPETVIHAVREVVEQYRGGGGQAAGQGSHR